MATLEGLFQGTLGDLHVAESLANEGRSADALEVIDELLGLDSQADADAIIAALMAQLQTPAMQPEMISTAVLKNGDHVINVEGSRMRLGAAALPSILRMRACCFTDRLEKEEIRTDSGVAMPGELARAAVTNSIVIQRLFARSPDMLALAAQPYLLLNDWPHATEVLGRCLDLDPENTTANEMVSLIDANIRRLIDDDHPRDQTFFTMVAMLVTLQDIRQQSLNKRG